MMHITVIAVGRLSESWWRDAAAEYGKRLSRYCQLEVIEVADEKTPEKASEGERQRILNTEGARILKAADTGSPIWALDIRGKKMDSETFAESIDELSLQGSSHLQFVIGGSLGLSGDVLAASGRRISFSDMTFPHQLMRVILLEQIYRGFRIIRGEPYHK